MSTKVVFTFGLSRLILNVLPTNLGQQKLLASQMTVRNRTPKRSSSPHAPTWPGLLRRPRQLQHPYWHAAQCWDGEFYLGPQRFFVRRGKGEKALDGNLSKFPTGFLQLAGNLQSKSYKAWNQPCWISDMWINFSRSFVGSKQLWLILEGIKFPVIIKLLLTPFHSKITL